MTVLFMHRVLLDSSCLSPAFQNVYITAAYRNSPFSNPRDEYGLPVLPPP